MLDNPWALGVDRTKQTIYQPIVDYTYWPMFGFFINWKTIQFNNKNESVEDLYKVHKIVLDNISANMVSLVQTGKYGAAHAEYPKTLVCYVVNYVSYTFTLHEDITTYGRVNKEGKVLVRA